MPIFEYRCADCGHDFELLVRSDTRLACPQCASTELAKQLSVFATADTTPAPPSFGPCGGCGHPDGPGACGMQ